MIIALKPIRLSQLFAIVLLFLMTASFVQAYTLEITEEHLQDKVSAMMPMIKKNMFVAVTISDPKIDLIKESNEIGLFTHIEVIALGSLKGSGRAKITGKLKYVADKGEFYFQNPKIISLELDNVEKKFMPKIKQLTQLAMTKTMSAYPVYRFNEEDMKQKLTKSALKSVTVEQEKLLVTLSLF